MYTTIACPHATTSEHVHHRSVWIFCHCIQYTQHEVSSKHVKIIGESGGAVGQKWGTNTPPPPLCPTSLPLPQTLFRGFRGFHSRKKCLESKMPVAASVIGYTESATSDNLFHAMQMQFGRSRTLTPTVVGCHNTAVAVIWRDG
jgi:hypothetical protein